MSLQKTTFGFFAGLILFAQPAAAEQYGIIVGISSYKAANDLTLGPTNDARAVREYWIDSGMNPANIETLGEELATLMDFSTIIDKVASMTSPADTVSIYWSGHGGPGNLITYDGTLSAALLGQLLGKLPVRNIKMIIDACHACSIRFPNIPGKRVTVLGVVGPDKYAQQFGMLNQRGQWEMRGLGTYLYLEGMRGQRRNPTAVAPADQNRDGQVSLSEAQSFMNGSLQNRILDEHNKNFTDKKSHLTPQIACIKELGSIDRWWEELTRGHMRVTLGPGQAYIVQDEYSANAHEFRAVLDVDLELEAPQPYSTSSNPGQTGMDRASEILRSIRNASSAPTPVAATDTASQSAPAPSRRGIWNFLGHAPPGNDEDDKKKKKPKPIWRINRSSSAPSTTSAVSANSASGATRAGFDRSMLDFIYMVKSVTVSCTVYQKTDHISSVPDTIIKQAGGRYSFKPPYYTCYLIVYPNIEAYSFSVISPDYPLHVNAGGYAFDIPDRLSFGGGGRFESETPVMANSQDWDVLQGPNYFNLQMQESQTQALRVMEIMKQKPDEAYFNRPEGKWEVVRGAITNHVPPGFSIALEPDFSKVAFYPNLLRSASGTTLHAEWNFE